MWVAMIYYITSCSLRVVQISMCVSLQALAQANTKFLRGLRYTGVGGTFCGWSEMILQVGNLQKGERCICSLLYGYAVLTISLGIRTWISLLVPPCTPSSSLSVTWQSRLTMWWWGDAAMWHKCCVWVSVISMPSLSPCGWSWGDGRGSSGCSSGCNSCTIIPLFFQPPVSLICSIFIIFFGTFSDWSSPTLFPLR